MPRRFVGETTVSGRTGSGIKLDARLAIAVGKRAKAEELVSRGSRWCESNGIHHQAYHFARLAWNLERGASDTRHVILG